MTAHATLTANRTSLAAHLSSPDGDVFFILRNRTNDLQDAETLFAKAKAHRNGRHPDADTDVAEASQFLAFLDWGCYEESDSPEVVFVD